MSNPYDNYEHGGPAGYQGHPGGPGVGRHGGQPEPDPFSPQMSVGQPGGYGFEQQGGYPPQQGPASDGGGQHRWKSAIGSEHHGPVQQPVVDERQYPVPESVPQESVPAPVPEPVSEQWNSQQQGSGQLPEWNGQQGYYTDAQSAVQPDRSLEVAAQMPVQQQSPAGQVLSGQWGQAPVQQDPWGAAPDAATDVERPAGPVPVATDTLADDGLLLKPAPEPLEKGWRPWVSKLTFGLVKLKPSAKQEAEDLQKSTVNAPLAKVHRLAVVGGKGGIGKSTVAASLLSLVAFLRGDRVIAVDANPDQGTLAARIEEKPGVEGTVEHLALKGQVPDHAGVRVHTVQNKHRLEVLGSQRDPQSTYKFNEHDYLTLDAILQRHYAVIGWDCGTTLESELFRTVANTVNAFVVVVQQSIPGVRDGLHTLAWLQAQGFGQVLKSTVVVLNATGRGKPLIDLEATEAKFAADYPGIPVLRLSYDRHLDEGGPIDLDRLKKQTRKELLAIAAACSEHYPARLAAPAYGH